MGSVLEDRLAQAAEACLLWRRLAASQQAHDWTAEEFYSRQQATLHKLAQLCEPEIKAAILRDPAGAELCGLRVTVDGQDVVVGNGLGIVYAGLRRAAGVEAADDMPMLRERVMACVSSTIADEKKRISDDLNGLNARALLGVLSANTLLNAALLIDHLDRRPRAALERLLYRELGNTPRPTLLDREPALPKNPTSKQRYAWLHWYLWRLELSEGVWRRDVRRVPQTLVVADGDRMLKNRSTGLPVDPLGPINARAYLALKRDLNRRGLPVKDPEGKKTVAASVGVSRATLRRYLEEDLSIKLTLHGDGSGTADFAMADLLASLRASSRKKRSDSAT